MPHEESFSDFDNIPWCQSLLTSPTYKQVAFTSRNHEWADSISPHLFRLFRRTLATPTTIRACIALEKPASPSSPVVESLLLISLGEDLDGHPGIAHGGIVSLLLDEVLGLAAEEALGVNVFTLSLNTKFKRALGIPGVVLGRAWCTKADGRKRWVSGVLEDGEGGVYAEAESLFIRGKDSNLPPPSKL